MIFLADCWNKESVLLADSLRAAIPGCPVYTIICDGFLPEDVKNPYAWYARMGEENGKPLFFDQLKVPDGWEIRPGGVNAEVWDYDVLRARVFCVPESPHRIIQRVDWLNRAEKTLWQDLYNRHGRRFAQVVLDEKQRPLSQTVFDIRGREFLFESFTTGTIILRVGETECFFASRADFVVHWLKQLGADTSRILYNSLSTPFQVSRRIRARDGGQHDLLFWQEGVRTEIPGNMELLFRDEKGGSSAVVVTGREAYSRFLSLGAPAERLYSLGYVYPLCESREREDAALILTNSDQVEQLSALCAALPKLHFYVAALTEMSPVLGAMAKWNNVTLLPNVELPRVEKLLQRCRFYLDINHRNEILDGVFRAFLGRLPILGFETTLHNRAFTAPEHCFDPAKPEELQRMITLLREAIENPTVYRLLQERQEQHAMTESPERYRALLEETGGEAL